jgi:response regulator RpfG family c-di-GMP phosphodiesterase
MPLDLDPSNRDVAENYPSVGANLRRGTIRRDDRGVDLEFHHPQECDGYDLFPGCIGDEAPLSARIVAVADAYSALTSERPYRRALSPADAVDAIRSGAGLHYDPDIVAFLERLVHGDSSGDHPSGSATRTTTLSHSGSTLASLA